MMEGLGVLLEALTESRPRWRWKTFRTVSVPNLCKPRSIQRNSSKIRLYNACRPN